MEKIDQYLDELNELENEEKELLEKQEELRKLLEENRRKQKDKSDELYLEGKYYYNKPKRQEIIDLIINRQLPEGTVQEMEYLHVQWETGSISKEEILTFKQFEGLFHRTSHKKKNLAFVAEKVRAFINGGGYNK